MRDFSLPRGFLITEQRSSLDIHVLHSGSVFHSAVSDISPCAACRPASPFDIMVPLSNRIQAYVVGATCAVDFGTYTSRHYQLLLLDIRTRPRPGSL